MTTGMEELEPLLRKISEWKKAALQGDEKALKVFDTIGLDRKKIRSTGIDEIFLKVADYNQKKEEK